MDIQVDHEYVGRFGGVVLERQDLKSNFTSTSLGLLIEVPVPGNDPCLHFPFPLFVSSSPSIWSVSLCEVRLLAARQVILGTFFPRNAAS